MAFPDMDAELCFLVFILYFVLFLDLYSIFVELSCARGVQNRRKSRWPKSVHCLKENEAAGRDTLAMRKFKNINAEQRNICVPVFLPVHEILLPYSRANGHITATQKTRLWGQNLKK